MIKLCDPCYLCVIILPYESFLVQKLEHCTWICLPRASLGRLLTKQNAEFQLVIQELTLFCSAKLATNTRI